MKKIVFIIFVMIGFIMSSIMNIPATVLAQKTVIMLMT